VELGFGGGAVSADCASRDDRAARAATIDHDEPIADPVDSKVLARDVPPALRAINEVEIVRGWGVAEPTVDFAFQLLQAGRAAFAPDVERETRNTDEIVLTQRGSRGVGLGPQHRNGTQPFCHIIDDTAFVKVRARLNYFFSSTNEMTDLAARSLA
jgi:hypothetical protein